MPKLRKAERKRRGIWGILSEAVGAYTKFMADVKKNYDVPDVLAMPVTKSAGLSQRWGRPQAEREQQPHFAVGGWLSDEYFAMVECPTNLQKAMEMLKAKQALNEERMVLENKTCWGMKSVRPKVQVLADAKKTGKPMQFGKPMNICSEKHFELPIDKCSYKGRSFFRGDTIRDETGFYAVFSEQGTSASRMPAAKFLDAIARLPGNSGEDAYAAGA